MPTTVDVGAARPIMVRLAFGWINHDMNNRHTIYTYGKVTVKRMRGWA